MVRRGNCDDVQILVLDHLAKIGVGLHGVLLLLELLNFFPQHFLIDIAQRGDANTFDGLEAAQMILAAAFKADDTDPNIAVGAGNLRPKPRGHCAGASGERGGLEK